MTAILQLLVRLILEILFEGIVEAGWRGILARGRNDSAARNPWVAACSYFMMGAIAGGISVWVIPVHLFDQRALRILSLAVTPIVLGVYFVLAERLTTQESGWHDKRDRFSYGFTFALAMGLIRYIFES